MAKIIGLPKLSPTMEEGTLVRWVKREGEAIEVDDLVAEVETDKATMEFRSFDRGYLLKQLVAEGTTLEPDQPVAIFGEKKDDDIQALLKQVGASSGGAPAAEEGGGDSPAPASPASSSTQDKGAKTQDKRAPAAGGDRLLASPVVRKLAREQDIDLSQIAGSGPFGRIIKRDLEALDDDVRQGSPGPAMRGPSLAPSAATGPRKAAAASSTVGGASRADAAVAESGGRLEKLSSMRKTIARRLTESKQTVPHFYLSIDVDAEGLLQARAEINESLKATGEKISLNDLILKACAVALRKVPACNASFRGDAILYHDRVDISVAVAVPEGLVTPVVRQADRLGVLEIGQTVRALAGRAKEKKLKPEEMSDGTFSLSNLGMFGIDAFSAVINPPEGAIIAVGQVRDEAVVKQGDVRPGKRMALTLSCDHRVVDGAVGAEFLRVLRSYLENPLHMIL